MRAPRTACPENNPCHPKLHQNRREKKEGEADNGRNPAGRMATGVGARSSRRGCPERPPKLESVATTNRGEGEWRTGERTRLALRWKEWKGR